MAPSSKAGADGLVGIALVSLHLVELAAQADDLRRGTGVIRGRQDTFARGDLLLNRSAGLGLKNGLQPLR